MKLTAKVYVALKCGVLAHASEATACRPLAEPNLAGYACRIGKFIELELDAPDEAAAKQRLGEMCERLLSNTVIEDYRIEVGARA